jgi:hypothetical protein
MQLTNRVPVTARSERHLKIFDGEVDGGGATGVGGVRGIDETGPKLSFRAQIWQGITRLQRRLSSSRTPSSNANEQHK